MGKGLLFFCCASCILILTIINLSIGPIISGAITRKFRINPGTLNCKAAKDELDKEKDDSTITDDEIKYGSEYEYNSCQREKGMHDMEYTAFIFDIVIGFVLTFVYVIFNGLVYTTVYTDIYKRDGDYAFAEKDGNDFKCFYFDNEYNGNSIYAKISDLGKKQYNYKKEWSKDINSPCLVSDEVALYSCAGAEKPDYLKGTHGTSGRYAACDYLYVGRNVQSGIENKDLSDRFLTTLILSLIVCLANIGLALFGFLLFRTPGDF